MVNIHNQLWSKTQVYGTYFQSMQHYNFHTSTISQEFFFYILFLNFENHVSQFYTQKNNGPQVGKSNKRLSPKSILVPLLEIKVVCILNVFFQKIKENFAKMCFESTVICVVDFGQIAVSWQIYENFFLYMVVVGEIPL